ncbi:class I SAM-dependent methyltransferase [Pontivivens ytuae]|uniref:Methyltransferase domain-containing protein n=1 Tax=Pontivivens ytuae TaxID=2789856 RepID=A0A7S9LW06_9RHOB|nr:methyltransferase domain-containing protein [Pontivivens ytuae]QPH56134.1 methyltransferase domain-containing protein [Pontivivens ytuae]
MDATYRYQRRFYDLTRRYFLLGRDTLIEDLAPGQGETVLEVACGTGRNLARIGARYPGVSLYGLDISREMLRTAEVKLGDRARLAAADACTFDGSVLFGVERFDRIVLSYSLSMIPDWPAAVEQALRHLGPDGRLHIVDFGDQARLPAWFRSILRTWLAKFHVTPRGDMEAVLTDLAARHGVTCTFRPLYRGYAWSAVLAR